jgi:protein-ribulosamine 3-kinase
MLSASLQNTLKSFITDNTGTSASSIELLMVGGGSINQTYQILINKKEKFFCKINSASRFPLMFEKEKSGLEILASAKIIRVPAVIGTFTENDSQVILLEWIEQGVRSERFWKIFGEQLAALHSIPCGYAGLNEDNYMGALSQFNHPSSEWTDFFIHQRLEPQIRLALDKRLLQPLHHKQFEKLYKALPGIFPPANLCLLHGDLWSGNFLCDHLSLPVLIDPAVYYGHPAMDLAMTTLFGGFDPIFYQSYNRQIPFPTNHKEQWEICNLYPLLIHLNLFGKGYLQSIVSIIQYY